MESISLTTPGLLFSAISLLLLAYTNRFLAIASLIRSLHDKYLADHDKLILIQINVLKKRVFLIMAMQVIGITSLLLCVFCMFLLFEQLIFWGKVVFGIALIFLLVSLGLSIWEILISSRALNLQLLDIKEEQQRVGEVADLLKEDKL